MMHKLTTHFRLHNICYNFSVVQLFCDVDACCQLVYMPWKLYKIIHEDFDLVKMCADNRMISRALH